MKKVALIFTLFILTPLLTLAQTVATGAAEDRKDVHADFHVVCEVSKVAQSLEKSPLFQEKADRAYRLASMLEAGIKTTEVKSVYKAVTVSSPDQKEILWRQAAKDAGLKRWKCRTLKYLTK